MLYLIMLRLSFQNEMIYLTYDKELIKKQSIDFYYDMKRKTEILADSGNNLIYPDYSRRFITPVQCHKFWDAKTGFSFYS